MFLHLKNVSFLMVLFFFFKRHTTFKTELNRDSGRWLSEIEIDSEEELVRAGLRMSN